MVADLTEQDFYLLHLSLTNRMHTMDKLMSDWLTRDDEDSKALLNIYIKELEQIEDIEKRLLLKK